MDLELREKHFITGGTDGSSGARSPPHREGARIAICGRDQERLDEAGAALGANALCVRAV